MSNIKTTFFNAALFIIFPCFFFYQSLLGLGMISPFLGGYFGFATAALSIPVLSYYAVTLIKTRKLNMPDGLYFSFITYFLVVVLFNLSFMQDRTIPYSHLASIMQSLVLYCIASQLDLKSRQLKLICYASFTAMSLIIFSYSTQGSFNLRASGVEVEHLASYQSFALCYFVIFALLIQSTSTIKHRLFIYTIAAAALYLNVARSEFVGALIFMTFYEFFISRRKSMLIPSILLISIPVITIAVTLAITFDTTIPENRIGLLLNPSQDQSALMRNEFASNGFDTISQNPIFGDYAGYEPGAYIHNILSAWVDLGALGFAAFTFMLLIPTVLCIQKAMLNRDRDNSLVLCLSLLIVTITLLVAGKYFTYLLAPISLGIFSNISKERWRHVNRQWRTSEAKANREPLASS